MSFITQYKFEKNDRFWNAYIIPHREGRYCVVAEYGKVNYPPSGVEVKRTNLQRRFQAFDLVNTLCNKRLAIGYELIDLGFTRSIDEAVIRHLPNYIRDYRVWESRASQ